MQSKKLISGLAIMGLVGFACQIIQPTASDSPRQFVTQTVPAVATEITLGAPEITVQPSPTAAIESTSVVLPGFAVNIPRTTHTVTRLPNGNILILGGTTQQDDFALDEELINPRSGQVSWIKPMHTPRGGHTATLLQDGRILVVGGYNLPQQWLSDAEIYDPKSDTWTDTQPHYSHGTAHTATLLKNGSVLVVGGSTGSGVCTEKVEIFDPVTNAWMQAASLQEGRYEHTAQLLDDGRVLVAGGSTAVGTEPLDGSALLYDSELDAWTKVAPMQVTRYHGESVKLSDGNVLVAGGVAFGTEPRNILSDAEIYNPASNQWHAVARMREARYAFLLFSLPDGRILAANGTRDQDRFWTENSFVPEIEVYDPQTNQWQTIGRLPKPGAFSAGTQLLDGQIWISGGQVREEILIDTWLIDVPG